MGGDGICSFLYYYWDHIKHLLVANKGEIMKNTYYVVGIHSLLQCVEKECKNKKELRKVTERLSDSGYDIEVYKILKNGEQIYIDNL